MLVALGGIWLAWAVYVKRLVDYEQLYQRFKPLHTLFKEQFFTEKLYHKVLAEGYLLAARDLYTVFERIAIDGFINWLSSAVVKAGEFLRVIHAGKLNWYVFGLTVGLCVIAFILVATIAGGG
ncbi:MAG: hypothetical protein GXO03_04465 [Aquificae bacterium]|nr:hypothetical protein [Aquificota bacterium]